MEFDAGPALQVMCMYSYWHLSMLCPIKRSIVHKACECYSLYHRCFRAEKRGLENSLYCMGWESVHVSKYRRVPVTWTIVAMTTLGISFFLIMAQAIMMSHRMFMDFHLTGVCQMLACWMEIPSLSINVRDIFANRISLSPAGNVPSYDTNFI